ncbi:MAG TPA: universal stress protein [Candidatus Binataceae bacterium]|nr:universal stress protein [Candidatus Binataceae bacterium]
MALPIRKILSPIDFGENSLNALDVAAEFARQASATVVVLHVVSLMLTPDEMPVELYREQEAQAKDKLNQIVAAQLKGLESEIIVHVGDPAKIIVEAAETLGADLIVMATHGRTGISRVLMGSVTERVLRDAPCPVLTVRRPDGMKGLVGSKMTINPVTASPDDTLAEVQTRMRQGRFRSMPVVQDGKLIGIITDRDVREHAGEIDKTGVALVMSKDVMTVKPETSIWDAARLLIDHKVGGLPVVENGQLVGMVTTIDLLKAFVALAH